MLVAAAGFVGGARDVAAQPAEQAAFTGVSGRVVRPDTGAGIPEITVEAADTGALATTDRDGYFELRLAPGTYTLRVSGELHERRRIRGVVVKRSGGATEVQVKLSEDAIEEVIVEGKVEKRSEAGQLQLRKKSTTVSDRLSAQEISKTPDSSAGDAVKRVVSVAIIDGKYVVLRGLEGRYVSTLLNGVVLPSPEPDRNAVPLDLFPASLLSNLTVVKSYGAEYPGQFGGGTLLIETNSFPDSFDVKLTASTAANSSTTGADGLGNASGGGLGFFGYDGGGRELPSEVPLDMPVRGLPAADTEAIGESFADVWSPQAETGMPNLSLGATIGDTLEPGGSRKLGYLTSLSFRRGVGFRDGIARKTSLQQGALEITDDLTYQSAKVEATVGALVNLGYAPDVDTSIELLGLYTHVGEDVTNRGGGYSESESTEIETSRLEFVERALSFAQLKGFHRVPAANALELRWQGNAAMTGRDELDSRDMTYLVYETGKRYKNQPGSGQRYFSHLADVSYGGGVDAMLPLPRVRLRAGAMAQQTDRDFDGRRFRFDFVGDDNSVRGLDPETMLTPDHIGPSFRLVEDTLQEDAYVASLGLLAGYASGEVELTDVARLIVGARWERADQALSNGSVFASAGIVADVERVDNDVLPTANAVYALSPTMNLRAAYSYTLVRPRFRELAPFLFFDYVRRRSVSGNPDLVSTHMHNADLRWEWFAGDTDVFAVSTFYKRFVDPIEQVTVNSGDDVSFKNAAGGDLVGAELEARRTLGKFKLGANVALMWSKVDLEGADAELQTSQTRPIYGQSPFTVNVNAGWADPRYVDVTLLYNAIGERITDVGIQGKPDVYEQPYHRVDLVASRAMRADLKLKLSASNLLDQKVTLQQGDVVVNQYAPGVSITLGLDWTP